jgi:hypothetical protein
MLCKLIIDSEGPNPDYCPPNPAIDAAAFHAYNVPPDVIVPAGTILTPDGTGLDWVHCFPHSGAFIDLKSGRPVRGPDGLVLAEPADEECRAAVEKNLVGWGAARRMNPVQARAALDKAVAATKALQARNEAAAAQTESATKA